MEKKLLVKSKSMMLVLEWEDFQLCSMMEVSLMPCKESLLEDIPYQNFVKKLKKHQEDKNLFQRLCFSCFWQEDTQLTNRQLRFQTNGESVED